MLVRKHDGREARLHFQSLLGRGGSGAVYAVDIVDGEGEETAAAAKLFTRGGSRAAAEFERECTVLFPKSNDDGMDDPRRDFVLRGLVATTSGDRASLPREIQSGIHPGSEVPILCMELLPAAVCDVLEALGRGFPEPVARHLFRGIAAGLAHLHSRKLYHLDLKTDNVCLRNNPTSLHPVLIDFSHAVVGDGKRVSAASSVGATRAVVQSASWRFAERGGVTTTSVDSVLMEEEKKSREELPESSPTKGKLYGVAHSQRQSSVGEVVKEAGSGGGGGGGGDVWDHSSSIRECTRGVPCRVGHGTPGLMPPEVIAARDAMRRGTVPDEYDPSRADMFLLGEMLFSMVTGSLLPWSLSGGVRGMPSNLGAHPTNAMYARFLDDPTFVATAFAPHGIHVPGGPHGTLSDLLQLLLHHDPEARPDADAVLLHAWAAGDDAQCARDANLAKEWWNWWEGGRRGKEPTSIDALLPDTSSSDSSIHHSSSSTSSAATAATKFLSSTTPPPAEVPPLFQSEAAALAVAQGMVAMGRMEEDGKEGDESVVEKAASDRVHANAPQLAAQASLQARDEAPEEVIVEHDSGEDHVIMARAITSGRPPSSIPSLRPATEGLVEDAEVGVGGDRTDGGDDDGGVFAAVGSALEGVWGSLFRQGTGVGSEEEGFDDFFVDPSHHVRRAAPGWGDASPATPIHLLAKAICDAIPSPPPSPPSPLSPPIPSSSPATQSPTTTNVPFSLDQIAAALGANSILPSSTPRSTVLSLLPPPSPHTPPSLSNPFPSLTHTTPLHPHPTQTWTPPIAIVHVQWLAKDTADILLLALTPHGNALLGDKDSTSIILTTTSLTPSHTALSTDVSSAPLFRPLISILKATIAQK